MGKLRVVFRDRSFVELTPQQVDLSNFLTKLYEAQNDEADLADLLVDVGVEKSSANRFAVAALREPGDSGLDESTGLTEEASPDVIGSLLDPESKLSKRLMEEYPNKSECASILDTIRRVDKEKLQFKCHFLSFTDDDCVKNIFNFLTLDTAIRGPDMFSTLPALAQEHNDVREHVEPEVRIYLDWMDRFDLSMTVRMCKHATQLDIPTLQKLLGCKIAMLTRDMDSEQLKKLLPIPDNFKSATHTRLATLEKDARWDSAMQK